MDQIVRPFGSVTVFGGATLDCIGQSHDVPVLGASNPGNVRRLPGGVAFNVACVLARIGLPTRLVSRVGADMSGELILEAAGKAGVELTGMTVSTTAATASYHAAIDDAGGLIVGIADMEVCSEISPAIVAGAAAEPGVSLWVIDANLPEDTLAFLAEEAAHAGRPLAALTVSPAKAVRLEPILDKIDYLFTNRREAAALLGRDPNDPGIAVARLATELAGHRATKVIVTNGAEPLSAATAREQRSFTPFRASVRGVNGAGDALAAGTIRGFASGHALSDSIRFGLAAAAMTLEAGSVLAAPFTEDALAERMGAGHLAQAAQQMAS